MAQMKYQLINYIAMKSIKWYTQTIHMKRKAKYLPLQI